MFKGYSSFIFTISYFMYRVRGTDHSHFVVGVELPGKGSIWVDRPEQSGERFFGSAT